MLLLHRPWDAIYHGSARSWHRITIGNKRQELCEPYQFFGSLALPALRFDRSQAPPSLLFPDENIPNLWLGQS